MYKAIGFDYGGVLNISKPIMPGLAEIFGIPQNELREEYLKHNHLANVGDMSYEDLWTKVATQLGQAGKAEQAVAHMHQQHSKEFDPLMLMLAEELRQKGYKTGLLSNNTKVNGARLREEGLDKYFDVFLISAEIGIQKPDPEAFQLLIDKLDVLPEELIFIDDSESSLRLAENIGYHPILFKNYEQLKSELTNLKIL